MNDQATRDPFSAALGGLHTASLSAGQLRYRDRRQGTTVVFPAGLVLASGFWRQSMRFPTCASLPIAPRSASAP